ncbi:carboxypeptidase-like regulatory domain-containing protein [Spirosoma daeguense]
MTRILQWTLLITLCTQLCYAQNNSARPARQTFTGLVRSTQDGSVAGVNVAIKRSSQGVTTNANGQYSIQVNSPNDTLVFSMIGYKTQAILVNNRSV